MNWGLLSPEYASSSLVEGANLSVAQRIVQDGPNVKATGSSPVGEANRSVAKWQGRGFIRLHRWFESTHGDQWVSEGQRRPAGFYPAYDASSSLV